EKTVLTQSALRHLARTCENADCDRQVERASVFPDVRRREIDRVFPGRDLESAVLDRGDNPVLPLLYRPMRETHGRETRNSQRGIRFDPDQIGFDAEYCS